MTLRELRYLVAIADHGHFGRAAEACHVSQPTLSTQLKKLEAYLGVALVERGSRAALLTERGRQVVPRARLILREAEQLIASTRACAGPLAGALQLGIIPTLSPYFLPWLLPAARKRFPELQPIVHEDFTHMLLERLRTHRIDLAIMALPLEFEEFETEPLFDEPFWLACPRGHRLARMTRVPAAELQRENLLLLTDGHCLRGQALAMCGLQSPLQDPPQGDFRATSLETLCQLVAEGLGCTLLPALAALAPAATSFRFAVRPLAAPQASRRIGLVWRRHCPRRAEFMLLAQMVQAQPPRGTQRIGGSVGASGKRRREAAPELAD
ncbi:MAG: transcriptional regulator [Hydrocarboniphaga sp.]|uniref:LysR substrate-binding domain-containing protein n=1 Tax=Hydrocarboniphaga sp. TaxID=2033016 RepID=UPI00261EDBB6|nr:LysR substrate-binding domain-containing protein [Hydrocarboniphaga sp.]MDB5973105.1 transcriptional regulator [Hydrocarboniphaga sp.]